MNSIAASLAFARPYIGDGYGPLDTQFALVQDGNAWFGGINCTQSLE